MRKRTPIGEILVGLGRISPEDVQSALALQRERGGYFGDALIALGLVTPAEVEWGLADQYDLPFVNLRPDGIDRETAARVPAAWAREHLVLPVLRDGDTVTVVLADPGDLGRLIEVRHFTGAAHVEPALSTPATIRALIDAVHGEAGLAPVSLPGFLAEALEAGAGEVGVSLRGGRASAWARRDTVSRRPLEGDGLAELRRLVTPFPASGGAQGGVRRWTARIAVSGSWWVAECHAVGDGPTLEWSARFTGTEDVHLPLAVVESEVRTRVAEALRHGPVVAEVRAEWGGEGSLARTLPALPGLLLDREPRTVHLSDRECSAAEGEILVPVGDSLRGAVESVRPFALDSLTVDVQDAFLLDVRAARRTAPLAVFHLRSGRAVETADLRLVLRREGDALVWTRTDAADAAD